MKTEIIYTPEKGFVLPQDMVALPHQLQGSPLSNLAEFAARSCYDSLGMEKSRATKEYHENIISSNHLSVYEGCNLTICWNFVDKKSLLEHAIVLINRPGIYTRFSEDSCCFYTTLNARAALEWYIWEAPTLLGSSHIKQQMERVISWEFYKAMPEVFKAVDVPPNGDMDFNWKIVEPKTLDEIWVSFWITEMSRNCSMEVLRHSDRSAISQRSTRYCDEYDSKLIHHPLIEQYGIDTESNLFKESLTASRTLYKFLFDSLQEKQMADGVDRSTAKKQARGAARQYLEGGIETKFVFSASLSQWQHIIQMRSHYSADGEIQCFANSVNTELVKIYPQWFRPLKMSLPC